MLHRICSRAVILKTKMSARYIYMPTSIAKGLVCFFLEFVSCIIIRLVSLAIHCIPFLFLVLLIFHSMRRQRRLSPRKHSQQQKINSEKSITWSGEKNATKAITNKIFGDTQRISVHTSCIMHAAFLNWQCQRAAGLK